MHVVGPGSVIGGRYAVRTRLVAHPEWERWTALDTSADREVLLLCVDRDWSQASPTLDAARRAAGVGDRRLARVLDVGVFDRVGYVVEESLPGSRSLAEVLLAGPVPAEEVRRICGETAAGLEAARNRGLHHGTLTADHVLLLSDGSVKVRGVATEATLRGLDEGPGDELARADAQALASLTYYGLTRRWPITVWSAEPTSPTAASRRIVPPAELLTGVPPELDAFVVATLQGTRAAAVTPGEVVASLAPWSAVPVGPLGDVSTVSGPDVSGPDVDAVTLDAAGAPTTEGEAAAEATAEAATESDAKTDTGAEVGANTEADTVAAGATSPKPGAPARAALGAAGQAAGAVAERLAGLGRHTADRVESRVAELSAARERREDERVRVADGLIMSLRTSSVAGTDTRLSEVLQETPPGPDDLPPEVQRSEEQERADHRLALVIVSAFVALLALLGFLGLPRIGIGNVTTLGASRSAAAASSSATEATGGGSAAAAPTGTPAPLTPVAIVGSAAYEPQSGGQVPSSTSARAYDGNPDTLWRSGKWYATADFGGYDIPGIGLILDLGQLTGVRQVRLTLPAGQVGTVFVANQATTAGATPLGTFTEATDVVIDAPGGTPVTGQLVIVYVTQLGPDGEGRFRAQVAEAVVSK